MLRPLRPYQLATDVVVAVLFALVAVSWETSFGFSAYPGSGPGGAAMALLFAAALGVRRLLPGASLGVAWLAAIVQMALLLAPRPANIAVFAVLYVTAAYGSRAVYWAGFGSAILGAVVITGYLFAVLNGVTLATLPTAIAVLVAALFALLLSWTVGALVRAALRARDTRIAQQRAEAEAAAEQERVRIARDMHDVVAHSLAVVIAQADGARYALAARSGNRDGVASGPATAAETDPAVTALTTISTTARAALADVRLLLTQLRHSQAEGPQPQLADLDELYAQVRAAGVDLVIDIDPAPAGSPPPALQLAVYRILQEALTNALRHGDGGRVEVRQAWLADRVDIEVRNGRSGGAVAGGGHGLIGMRERAQLVGGRLDAGADGPDFAVRAALPAGAAA